MISPLAQIYTIFERDRAEKTLVKISKKGLYCVLGALRKSYWLAEKMLKTLNNFFESPSPEKILDPPLSNSMLMQKVKCGKRSTSSFFLLFLIKERLCLKTTIMYGAHYQENDKQTQWRV